MSKPTISAIAAIGQNRELGKEDDLIWRIPADLKRLRELTTGHPLIMGRKTYESIGRPLPNRTNIVISRNSNFDAPGCTIVPSLEAAIEAARAVEQDEIFIFGGAAIYELAMPLTDKLYLTIIEALDPEADTFFPVYEDQFTETEREAGSTADGLRYAWVTLERRHD
ncbi:hypothetical protein CL655_01265 [bacterium]|nr:hypothetical protein [bacterium]